MKVNRTLLYAGALLLVLLAFFQIQGGVEKAQQNQNPALSDKPQGTPRKGWRLMLIFLRPVFWG
ncbi:MAG: hypothetical protein IBX50_19955 [Marinospirillum sp.]|uniref:hypothetical protein n=1 Tax=Marinospirillum sp. TaxID=2183934 RepID=UPI0019F8A007|nr:hypothetical protein [Marinospirillum sp.]MBE0508959.1 hypothetical protein [Marinospirillum sp.]